MIMALPLRSLAVLDLPPFVVMTSGLIWKQKVSLLQICIHWQQNITTNMRHLDQIDIWESKFSTKKFTRWTDPFDFVRVIPPSNPETA